MIRVEKIAESLYSESIKFAKNLSIPSQTFKEVMSIFSSLDGVRVVSKRPQKGAFEINGLMKEIQKGLRKCRKFESKYRVILQKPGSRERKRYLIEIRPNLSDLPATAKARFNNESATFEDGPYKGEEVVWSSRIPEEETPSLDTCSDDLLIIVPDMYRATFYGWKRRS